MTAATRSVSLTPADIQPVAGRLDEYLNESSARVALLVDRDGHVLVTSGASIELDLVAFGTLAAADFGANEQLAHLVGERDFRTLVHRGPRTSLAVAGVGGNALLVTIFDSGAAPGRVRRAAASVADELGAMIGGALRGEGHHASGARGVLAGAEEEIDRMFDW